MHVSVVILAAPFVLFFSLLATLKAIQLTTYIHYEQLGAIRDAPSEDLPRIRLLQLNTFWRPRLAHLFVDEYVSERSLLLLDQIADFDIICLNEAFQFGSHIVDTFINKSAALGFKYVVSGATVPLLSRQVIDSGVLILSKYPILTTDAIVFEPGCSFDAFAAKGAVYAQIAIGPTRKVHVFSSHLQASYGEVTDRDFRVRQIQSIDIRKLISKWANQTNERDLIAVLADLNIDSIGEGPEYSVLLTNMAVPGYRLVDTLSANGSHAMTLGVSVEGTDRPVEPLLTMPEDWGRPQSIDYIFLYEPRAAPVYRGYRTEVVKFGVEGRPYQQLSDHLGLVCTVDFA
jgi:endonuclease/exonuclease/phosphatase family metal-dependent hydrolase